MQDNWGNCATDAYQMQNDLNEFFNQNGYQLIDTPILEESELFIRKSGAEISTKLFSFIDQYGAKICLRPEITPSIIRHYIQNAENINLPFKIQYQGPIFRHDNTFRQNTQFGVEVIGGALVYSITNKIIHGNVKILDGDTLAWQGLIAAFIFVIFISFIRGNITRLLED